MAENLTVGMEAKIIHIVDRLSTKYELGKYEISFHTDANQGEAFYDRPVESVEDIGGFTVRFTDKSTLHVPFGAINDWNSPVFLEKWGDKIYATRRS